jgi:hypothetical protein
MIPLLSLIPGRAALYAGAAVAALAIGAYALHQHDSRVRAEQSLAESVAAMKQMQADHERAVAALQTTAAEATARAEASATIRSSIHAAPSSATCAGSAPVRAALDGLRQRANAGRGPDAGAKQPVDLPARAAAAAAR